MNGAIKILYLASLRERAGRAEEAVELAPGIETLGALTDWLVARGGDTGAMLSDGLSNGRAIRSAVNHRLAGRDQRVAPGDEVAFFPPFTGG